MKLTYDPARNIAYLRLHQKRVSIGKFMSVLWTCPHNVSIKSKYIDTCLSRVDVIDMLS